MKFKLFTGLILGALVMLGGCSRSAEVRYKVSVELEEDGQIHGGSSIWTWQIQRPTLALASPYDSDFRGEAARVPLAGHPTIYALIINAEADTHYAPLLVEQLFGVGSRESRQSGKPYDRVKDVRDIASRVGERVELDCRDPKACPMLIWFEREGDPTSIKMVDPKALPAVTGGVKLRRITVEVTNDMPSYSISNYLPWLAALGRERATLIPHQRRRPGDGLGKPQWTAIQMVGTRSFSTELYR